MALVESCSGTSQAPPKELFDLAWEPILDDGITIHRPPVKYGI